MVVPESSTISGATENSADRPMRLRMTGITKRFGGVHALEGVNFEAKAGEVHALCGENGAGKSTLMKILAGAIVADEGALELDGMSVSFSTPRNAEDAGVRIIYQELNLVPELTAAANIFLGRERRNALGLLNARAMEDETKRLFDRLGAAISPRAIVGDLRIGDQQMVEIAKALTFAAKIVVMDEPTSALSDAEVARLYKVIHDLRAAGTAVIYISHKMNEVFSLAERVTVLRDGRLVATAQRAEATPDQVVRWMVGREIGAFAFTPHAVGAKELLRVENVCLPASIGSGRPSLSNISFTLQHGEVLGVAGLLGAGRTELLELLFGAAPKASTGSILLDGRSARFQKPAEAIAAGIALVTEDRKNLGLFDRMTVTENITICHLSDLARSGFMKTRDERLAVSHAIKRHAVKTASGSLPITALSGGNQQKCILARWLLTGPRVLLLDEPTRGIDVGAKAEIYALIRELAAHEGIGILMTSSELPELLAVSDRVLVLCEGRVTALLPRAEADEESIMRAATAFLDRSTPLAAS
ncbi:MAG: sugar ABC transporter ATP-binding protein [Isosphaeraceae bacterium]